MSSNKANRAIEKGKECHGKEAAEHSYKVLLKRSLS